MSASTNVTCFHCGQPIACEDDDWETVQANLDQHFAHDCRREPA
jgi:DNA-directed RNA polymerase subunit N (RpoN/RPB10)